MRFAASVKDWIVSIYAFAVFPTGINQAEVCIDAIICAANSPRPKLSLGQNSLTAFKFDSLNC